MKGTSAIAVALLAPSVSAAWSPFSTAERDLLDFEVAPLGVWTSRGYGFALNATDGEIVLYEETAISCILPASNGTVVENFVENVEVSDDGTLAVWGPGMMSPITFDFSEAGFESGCDNGVTPVVGDGDYERDSLFEFDVLSQVFTENYAFFELRGVDWNTLTAQVRANLTSESTDDELFVAFQSLLGPLHDQQVFVSGNDTLYYESKSWAIHEQMMNEAIAQGAEMWSYIEAQGEKWELILASYMEGGELSGQLFDVDTGGVAYGRFADTATGYMLFNDFYAADKDAYAETLNQAFQALAGSTAMLIDIRAHGGGDATDALLLASHFASERTLAFTKRAVDKRAMDGYTNATEIYIEPGEEAYRHTGPVIILTSEATHGAGELFTLAMSQLPQTTRLGRNTSGEFSYALLHTLPNGWYFGLSNEEYAAPDGAVYEMTGIPPDLVFEADPFPLADRAEGIDSWLDLTLQYLTTTSTTGPSVAPAPTGNTFSPTASPKETPEPTEKSGVADTFAPQCLAALLVAAVTVSNA